MTNWIKRGFTLMEVNLAIFIMAVGVLAMVGLYPLGFRESQQSKEDVATAILADNVLNQLSMLLSSTNLVWSDWENICGGPGNQYPANGWYDYCNNGNPKPSFSDRAWDRIESCRKSGQSLEKPTSSKLQWAVVAKQMNINTMSLSFRATRKDQGRQLFAQPLYYTEVHFQGSR